jgi:alpha-L-arabinofuranosidase
MAACMSGSSALIHAPIHARAHAPRVLAGTLANSLTRWLSYHPNAVGIHELLLLCEQLKSVPQLSVYTGYSMGRAYIPMNESQVFATDALDMIEYALGASNTPFGSRRAAAGHPAPFPLSRLEVGNEERLMGPDEYPGHYKLITSQIWARHPNMTVVASGRWGPDIAGNPCLTGQRCDAWDDHYYRTPDVMAGMGHQYDDYNRSLPDVFVGEFAANVGHHMNLQAAIAEAVFMLGFEANGDKVRSASFAPMLCNVNGTQWGYDLINFDASRMYALPSYYMQVMLREAAGDYVLKSTLGGDVTIATASLKGRDQLVLKFAAYIGTDTSVSIDISAFSTVGNTATLTVLASTAGAEAANTLDQPNAVVPTSTTIPVDGPAFTVLVPAWSVVTITLPVAIQ